MIVKEIQKEKRKNGSHGIRTRDLWNVTDRQTDGRTLIKCVDLTNYIKKGETYFLNQSGSLSKIAPSFGTSNRMETDIWCS